MYSAYMIVSKSIMTQSNKLKTEFTNENTLNQHLSHRQILGLIIFVYLFPYGNIHMETNTSSNGEKY